MLTSFAVASAQNNAVATVHSWERFAGMVTVFAPNGHGNVTGDYHFSDQPIAQVDQAKANALVEMNTKLVSAFQRTRGHMGIPIPPGAIILEGTPWGGITTRTQSTITTEWWAEVNAAFYDPRSDDYAVRFEAVYCGDGHEGSIGCTAYVEMSWHQLHAAVDRAKPYVSAVGHLSYDPVKNYNQLVGVEQTIANGGFNEFGYLSFNDLYSLNNTYVVNNVYKEWYAWNNGRQVSAQASGICTFASVMGQALTRFLLVNGVAAERWSIPHSESFLLYYANGADPNIWAKYDNWNGVRGFQDTTLYSPSVDAVYQLPPGVQVQIQPWIVYYNPESELMIYSVGVEFPGVGALAAFAQPF